MKRSATILFLLMLIFACGGKKTPNIENITVDLKIMRFDRDLFDNDLPTLKEKYGDFFDNFCDFVLNIGRPDSAGFSELFSSFRSDSIVLLAKLKADAMFDSYEPIFKSDLIDAFKYYRYYFPEANIPNIYTFTAGFNQSLILDENLVAVGLDKYLGENEDIYVSLGFSKYLVQNMRKERMLPEIMKVVALEKFPLSIVQPTLIEKMIYEGKILYFQEQVCPKLSGADLLGFSKDNLIFCENNEAQMWTYLVENKLLYSNSFSVISRFTEDAPFTPEFSQESPGKAANWIGLKIVEQYVKNTNTSLSELMEDLDFKKILRLSKYNPQ